METIVKKRIKQVLKGDQDAYAEIVEIYKEKVYMICYRMLGNRHEAEDIAQEAFLRAYVNIHSFNINLKDIVFNTLPAKTSSLKYEDRIEIDLSTNCMRVEELKKNDVLMEDSVIIY